MEKTQKKGTTERSVVPRTYKIIILGESNVGKSSIFLRYREDRFKEAIANTIGVNNSTKEIFVDGFPVCLYIWDTAGQERYKSLVSVFYREADGFIFVYDLTSPRSLEYLRQIMTELKGRVNPKFAAIVANKVDCLDEEKARTEHEELSKTAADFGYKPWMASAKTGKNVNDIFEDLARSLFYNLVKENNKQSDNMLLTKRRKKKLGRWCYI